jgi:hypothetical protein
MNRNLFFSTVLTLLACSFGAWARGPQGSASDWRLMLRDGWAIQSSAKVAENGEALSTAGFTPQGWYSTQAPSTVLAALVQNKVYPDPYFGMNLRLIPGTTYPIGANFSNMPMPEDSPFRVRWWYRNQFQMPAGFKGKTAWLHFDGINFRANICGISRNFGPCGFGSRTVGAVRMEVSASAISMIRVKCNSLTLVSSQGKYSYTVDSVLMT